MIDWYLLHDEEVDKPLIKELSSRNDVNLHFEAPPYDDMGTPGICRSTFNNYSRHNLWAINPGLYYDCPQNFHSLHYGHLIYDHWFNSQSTLSTVGLLRKQHWPHPYGDSQELFIKADNPFKPFPSKLYTKGEFLKYTVDVDQEQIVLINHNRKNEIINEYRFLAHKEKLICGCNYNNERVDKESYTFKECQRILKEIPFLYGDPYIIDFVEWNWPWNEDEVNRYSIMEINAFGFSGLYGMDCKVIVDYINDYYGSWDK